MAHLLINLMLMMIHISSKMYQHLKKAKLLLEEVLDSLQMLTSADIPAAIYNLLTQSTEALLLNQGRGRSPRIQTYYHDLHLQIKRRLNRVH